jgi:hypothetical protein
MKESFKFLSPEQIRYLAEMAEQARAALSRFAGYEVFYNSIALQLLDEWVDRHLRQFPEPSQRIRLLWVSFLGEMFRRHHGGEWALRGQSKEGGLVLQLRVAACTRQMFLVRSVVALPRVCRLPLLTTLRLPASS